ncbi:WXG100 family type VII secretion target [Streptomyces sp. NBC_01483]|uniref:WXG100 family type VII secretion target n=1 Tax=Streptomyces sp. NBC_01483 TaxID=2903883 RepID=UPI002E32A376|nr:WXG100 family type VII secretion target [Streptomyces sp. NBC_01483]
MSFSEFKVHLGELKQAIGTVTSQSEHVESVMTQIVADFEAVSTEWKTPSSASLEEVQQWFARSQADLHGLLDEVVRRLQAAYDNYHDMEMANYKNMQHDHGGSGPQVLTTGQTNTPHNGPAATPAAQQLKRLVTPVKDDAPVVADLPTRLT